MVDESQTRGVPCVECQAGIMQRKKITYLTWLNDDLITVPDFPAWVCDVCGRREYDGQALFQLNMLLNPNAGKPTPISRKHRISKKKPQQKGPRASRPE